MAMHLCLNLSSFFFFGPRLMIFFCVWRGCHAYQDKTAAD